MGELEVAHVAAFGASEGAALVSEELALDQRVGDRAAVDAHQPVGGAVAVAVDRADHEALAGARLAVDQHREIGLRHLLDEVADLADLRAVSHELWKGHLPFLGGQPRRRRRGRPLAVGQGVLHHAKEFAELHRLGDEVPGTQLHCGHGRIDRAVAGHHDDRDVPIDLPDPLERLQAVHPGHPDVEDDQMGKLLTDERQGLLRPRGRPGAIALRLEEALEHLAKRLFVVHDEDSLGFLGRGHRRVLLWAPFECRRRSLA